MNYMIVYFYYTWRLEKEGEEVMDEPEACCCPEPLHNLSVARRVDSASIIFSSSNVISAF